MDVLAVFLTAARRAVPHDHFLGKEAASGLLAVPLVVVLHAALLSITWIGQRRDMEPTLVCVMVSGRPTLAEAWRHRKPWLRS